MRERSAFIKPHITIFHVETIEPERYFWKIESTSNHTEPKKKKQKLKKRYMLQVVEVIVQKKGEMTGT